MIQLKPACFMREHVTIIFITSEVDNLVISGNCVHDFRCVLNDPKAEMLAHHIFDYFIHGGLHATTHIIKAEVLRPEVILC